VGACDVVGRYTNASVVNAGDGTGEHPTQALLDLYTVQQEIGPIDGLHVAFVGDVLHSRVARSGIAAFRMMGARVTVVAPPTLVPRHLAEALGAEVSADIRDIEDADVVYVLRMQLERMGQGGFVPSLAEYARMYQVNHARLRDGQRVMHAGPVNRGVEISGAVVDDPSTLIEAQAGNGLVVRMAVLYDVLTEDKAGAARAPGVTLEAA
jgi:aspartate carbamoyltransferase catalytic subunit